MSAANGSAPGDSRFDPDACSLVLLYAWMDLEAVRLFGVMGAVDAEYHAAHPEECWAVCVEAVVEHVNKSASAWGERSGWEARR